MRAEIKVGLFAAAILVLLGWATMKVGSGTFSLSKGFELKVTLDDALGLKTKTAVELAGIRVGFVTGIAIAPDGRRADVTIKITEKHLQVTDKTVARVRAKGFLGDTYVELIPGPADAAPLASGGELINGGAAGDLNMLMTDFGEIARDIKAITGSLRTLTAGEDAPVAKTVMNLEKFAGVMRELAEQNQRNMNTIATNFASLSQSLRQMVANGRPDVEESLSRIASISRKLDQDQGTIGHLINNRATGEKIDEAVDGLNDALGGFKRLQTEIGYHTEYLGQSKDFKNYVHLNLRPRPDEAFLLEFVQDRTPSPNRTTDTTTVTAGGTTSTVTTQTDSVARNSFRVSAQLAKRLYDFTLRGGIIESRGGLGLDYNRGPVGVSASAFDFSSTDGGKAHVKVSGKVNITPALYFLGGADDMLNPNQKTDWFVGAGLQFQDDDLKSLIAGGGASLIKK